MDKNASCSSVVFAGGGSRCLWQVGFWAEVAPVLHLAPRTVASVSAGATMACFIFSGCADIAMKHFQEITTLNRRNFYPFNPLKGCPAFPQYTLYRRGILATIDDSALQDLKRGPEIRVLLARPPRWSGPRLATLIGFFCYAVEKKIFAPVHPTLAARVGFKPEVVTVDRCNTPEELADLLLESSCTPPFTPVLYRGDRPALDGGLIDNAPVRILNKDEENILILLTRHYLPEQIPSIQGRTYVYPSEPIAIYKWDYTNPQGLQDAYDLGCQDGRTFLKKIGRTE